MSNRANLYADTDGDGTFDPVGPSSPLPVTTSGVPLPVSGAVTISPTGNTVQISQDVGENQVVLADNTVQISTAVGENVVALGALNTVQLSQTGTQNTVKLDQTDPNNKVRIASGQTVGLDASANTVKIAAAQTVAAVTEITNAVTIADGAEVKISQTGAENQVALADNTVQISTAVGENVVALGALNTVQLSQTGAQNTVKLDQTDPNNKVRIASGQLVGLDAAANTVKIAAAQTVAAVTDITNAVTVADGTEVKISQTGAENTVQLADNTVQISTAVGENVVALGALNTVQLSQTGAQNTVKLDQTDPNNKVRIASGQAVGFDTAANTVKLDQTDPNNKVRIASGQLVGLDAAANTVKIAAAQTVAAVTDITNAVTIADGAEVKISQTGAENQVALADNTVQISTAVGENVVALGALNTVQLSQTGTQNTVKLDQTDPNNKVRIASGQTVGLDAAANTVKIAAAQTVAAVTDITNAVTIADGAEVKISQTGTENQVALADNTVQISTAVGENVVALGALNTVQLSQTGSQNTVKIAAGQTVAAVTDITNAVTIADGAEVKISQTGAENQVALADNTVQISTAVGENVVALGALNTVQLSQTGSQNTVKLDQTDPNNKVRIASGQAVGFDASANTVKLDSANNTVKLSQSGTDNTVQFAAGSSVDVGTITNPVTIVSSGGAPLGVTAQGARYDAFGRSRVVQPMTLWDGHFQAALQMDRWVDYSVGTGATTHNGTNATVELTAQAASNDGAIVQSRRRVTYQPGKTLTVFVSCALAASAGDAGAARAGFFDADNGVFIEYDASSGETYWVYRRAGVDTRVNIDSGNGSDKDEITADIGVGRRNLYWFSLKWLGSGNIDCGVFFNNFPLTGHQFEFANAPTEITPFWASSSLPVTFELTQATSTSVRQLNAICASVSSEGGYNPRGLIAAAELGDVSQTTTERVVFALRVDPSARNVTVNPLYLSSYSIDASGTMTVRVYVVRGIKAGGLLANGASWTSPANRHAQYTSYTPFAYTYSASDGTAAPVLISGTRFTNSSEQTIDIEGQALLSVAPRDFAASAYDSDILYFTAQASAGGGGNKNVSLFTRWQELS